MDRTEIAHEPAVAPEAERTGSTPVARPDLRPRFDWLIGVAAGLLATLLSWFRLPTDAWDTIWAEDGPIFLFPWASGSGWSSVFTPYDGYLHFVPRLIGGLTYAVSDVDSYADTIVVLCCLAYGAIAGLVYVFSRDVITMPAARFALALITVLAPVAGWESMHNLANLHWFLLWLTPWLLLASPRSRVGLVLMSLLALAIALTEVQAAVFAPLVLWLWKRRDRWPIFISFAVGLIAQAVSVLVSPRVRVPAPAAPWESTVAGYLLNNGISFWDSRRPDMTALIVHLGWLVGLLAILPFLLAFGLAFWRGDRQLRTACVALLLASGIGWTVAFVINHDPSYYYTRIPVDSAHPLTLVRWATASQMFLIAAIPLLVGRMAVRSEWWRRLAPMILIALVAVMSTSLVQVGHPRGGTDWHDAVIGAEQSCTSNPAPTIDVPIQPGNWFLVLPCELVLSDE